MSEHKLFHDRTGRPVRIGDEVTGDAGDPRLQWGRVLRYERTDAIEGGILAGSVMAERYPCALIIDTPYGEAWLFAHQIAEMDSRAALDESR